jgi:hypothetical protein
MDGTAQDAPSRHTTTGRGTPRLSPAVSEYETPGMVRAAGQARRLAAPWADRLPKRAPDPGLDNRSWRD